jgi:hypothetical protein
VSDGLSIPTAAEQDRLERAWSAICAKIEAPPNTFPLRFGKQFDWAHCIFRQGSGWCLLDVHRGSEISRRFLPDEDALLYECAKSTTSALAGWHREKNMSPLSKALEGLYHRLDRRFNLRLQLGQHRRLAHAFQLPLMNRISQEWAQRLEQEFRSEGVGA